MKIQIENLKAQTRGVKLNVFQSADALLELNALIKHTNRLEQGQTYPLLSVSQQRELLKGFQKHYHSDKFEDERTFDWNIDNFLKSL